ncbi:tRNA 2-selenouridine(34) synthase MnmH [Azonexus sp. IMCC34839]|uniref:tRNA 2-selenouridine(34) synthase MnmH n=1 Tax=Azonexus sp. IMCC34839 TaxID=3133695 RepID=UPI00399ADD7B
MKQNRPTVADLAAYDEIIDVRSPAEFADDHIPGAINCPVLDDAQRAQVGTIYKQVSPFEAKKIGAALVSENIAHHLKERFLDRPKNWKPLIYCWRGGERSGSMTTIFRAIGWPAGQLDGGYKNYRRHVIEQLELLPGQFNFRVVCGPTGSAKTRILQALTALGEQVLDLETLACHKGSVLGVLPDQPQPSQKTFETLLWQALSAFDPSRPVYVEAESRKIGRMHVPEALMERIRNGECLQIDAPIEARVEFLLGDYAYFFDRPALLIERLGHLHSLVSNETLQRWVDFVHAADWPTLVRELLEQHYDPLYRRSQHSHFTGLQQPLVFAQNSLCTAAVDAAAQAIVQSRRAQTA